MRICLDVSLNVIIAQLFLAKDWIWAIEKRDRTDTSTLMSICRLGFVVKCQARCILGRGLNGKKKIRCCSPVSLRLRSIQVWGKKKKKLLNEFFFLLIPKQSNAVSGEKLHWTFIILQAPELKSAIRRMFYTSLGPKLLRKGWKLN